MRSTAWRRQSAAEANVLRRMASPFRLPPVPRECGVNRLEGERGFCGAGRLARVAAVSVHHGEEPPISGTRGSGTIFFSHCNMKCLFCQNYPISQYGNGREMDAETLAGEMLRIREQGVHNVNFVTPTPHVPQMLEAVLLARGKGFDLPVVYNTNGYDALETLALLDGVVDIYLPDAKYRSRGACGARLPEPPTTRGTTKPPSTRWCARSGSSPPGTTGSPPGGSSSAISSFREGWRRRRRCWRICRKGTVRSFPCP